MATSTDLRALGVDPNDQPAVLRWVARLPVTRTERIRLLRSLEGETLKPFDPRLFAQAVEGIPPA